ncbi:hypothetical protein ACROYT_G035500, partial [Oculina patagonica]
IMNLSLEEGAFPSEFKKSIVRPLIKKDTLDPDELSNQRPISNLSFLSKTLERIVASQIDEYLHDNGLYARMQSANRKYHSTETALIRVVNDIQRAIDDQCESVLVLLDLSAAFDTIDHEILLERLRFRYGFSNLVLQWFASYLTDRPQLTHSAGHVFFPASSIIMRSPSRLCFGTDVIFSPYFSIGRCYYGPR